MHLLQKYSDEFPLSDLSYVKVTSLLTHMAALLGPEATPGWRSDDFVPIYSMTTVSHLLEIIYLEILGDNADGTVPPWSTTSVSPTSPGLPTRGPRLTVLSASPTGPQAPTPTASTTDSPTPWRWQKLVENAFAIADEFVYLSLMTQVAEEDPVDFDVGLFHTEGIRVKAGNIRQAFTSSDCEVQLSPTLLSDLPAEQEVLQVMATMLTNPYKWGYRDNNTITSKTIVVYFNHINRSEIEVSDLSPSETVYMEMPTQADLEPLMHSGGTGRGRKSKHHVEVLTEDSDSATVAAHQLEFDSVVLSAGRRTSTELNMTVVTSGGAIHVQVLAEAMEDDRSRGRKEDKEEENMMNWKNRWPQRSGDNSLSVGAYIGVDYVPTTSVYDYSLHITAEVMDNLENFTQYTFFILDE